MGRETCFAAAAALAVVCLSVVGCNESGESSEVDQSATRHQALESSAADEVGGESASPTPILVSWASSATETRGKRIEFLVENTTSLPQEVELELVGVAPTGTVVSRSMGTVDVAAQSVVTLDYAAKDLPVQSIGLASTVSLVAFYDSTGPAIDGVAKTRRLQVATPAIHVTFASDTAEVTLRSPAAQALANRATSGSSTQQLKGLKTYSSNSKAMVDVDPTAAPARGIGLVSAGRPGLKGPQGRTLTAAMTTGAAQ